MHFRRITAAVLAAVSCISLSAQGRMTDEQVAEYIRSGVSDGKSTNQISSELLAKGVTKEQATRVYAAYKSGVDNKAAASGVATDGREHEITAPEDLGIDMAIIDESETPSKVFGYNIFRVGSLNFRPSTNIATPRNYILGPGDEVIIDVFGANQTTLRQTISPEGNINVEIFGPIYLNGKTIEQAESYLRKRLAGLYSGLDENQGNSEINLSLGKVRTIQISVVGEVRRPGTYSLSSLSSALNALYTAGGAVDPGTLRNIRVMRNGKEISCLDVYRILIDGDDSADTRLEDGDIILVGTYGSHVSVSGQVKRPMSFEMKESETLEDLFRFTGGFLPNAARENVCVQRYEGKFLSTFSVEAKDFADFTLRDGDAVTVAGRVNISNNRLEINGSVFVPGVYELTSEVNTLASLIEIAGGLMPEAFTQRVLISRTTDDRELETISVNLADILEGRAADVRLMNRDVVSVASVYDIREKNTMTISGYVLRPGDYPFSKNTTVEDLILLAGGLRDGASTSRVDISRRIINPEGMKVGGIVSETFSFPIKDGLVDDGAEAFILEPYDEVIVLKSPDFISRTRCSVSGEVNFEGDFAITTRNERLSDLIAKAGGVTDFAYLKGATLTRRANEQERRITSRALESMENSMDSLLVDDSILAQYYDVAIDLEKALANPGSSYDIVLRDGDQLQIPTISTTVKVSGSVMLPTTLTYDPSLTAIGYIRLCGGYAHRAMRRKAYVVRMNGNGGKMRRYSKIEPGSEIIVPDKGPKESGALSSAISTTANVASTTAILLSALKRL